jgi:hypothetical protein
MFLTELKVIAMMTQMASASAGRSTAAEQSSKNVEAITSVTAQTATGSQQVAQAAEVLNRLTSRLQDLVERFKLSHEEAGSGSGERHGNGAGRERTSEIAVSKNGRLTTREA